MSATHKPFLSEGVLPLSEIFGNTYVVQNYPEKYIAPQRGFPRKEHESAALAKRQGFVFGIYLYNGSNHWTRYIYLKPSEPLLDKWNDSQYEGYNIESFDFKEQKDGTTAIYATYMEGIGKRLLAYVLTEEVESCKNKAREVELGDSVL